MLRQLIFCLLVTFSFSCANACEWQDFDWKRMAKLPVLHEGRVKPLDTVARNALLVIHGKQSFKEDGEKYSAIQWLTKVLFAPEEVAESALFRIDNPDVLGAIGLKSHQGKYFSFQQLQPNLQEVERLGLEALKKESTSRSAFERDIVQLRNQVLLYWLMSHTIQLQDSLDFEREQNFYLEKVRLQQQGSLSQEDYEILLALQDRYQFLSQAAQFAIFPKTGKQPWQTMGEALLDVPSQKSLPTSLLLWGELSSGYRERIPEKFNTAVYSIDQAQQLQLNQQDRSRVYWESILLKVQPFFWCMVLYTALFLAAVVSRFFWRKGFYFISWALAVPALLLHSFGLFTRMYVQARPPVTSLYSSAVFIGWVAVLIFFFIEWKQRNALSLIGAAIIGATTQLIAHHLAQSGDSIEVMRAVLDSNFWLATHVVVITIGYACTYVSGFLANAYLVRRLLSGNWSKKKITEAAHTVYLVTGFSTLMSFTGTVLGGIWADQSWGRFWGWDPKENGALLIVLWCAALLHLRLARMVSDHCFLCLAALSTIVTSFSWFGVNLLGIGLHSYGFTEGTFAWLAGFILCQVLFVSIAGYSKRVKAID